MKKFIQTSCIFAIALVFISCKKTALDPTTNTVQTPATTQPASKTNQANPDDKVIIGGRTNEESCEPTTVALLAGQTIEAGTVTVSNDEDFIYVTYTTANGWVLSQTHLFVGNIALLPVNNAGNPIPGRFPNKSPHNNVTSYTYQVPISSIPLQTCGTIAAHSVVKKYNASNQLIDTQTGWGNGARINPTGGNWAMKFDYCSCSTF